MVFALVLAPERIEKISRPFNAKIDYAPADSAPAAAAAGASAAAAAGVVGSLPSPPSLSNFVAVAMGLVVAITSRPAQ